MNQQRDCKPRAPKLPGVLKDLFWDYDFAVLDWAADRDLIIGRVLTSGSWDAVTWLRSILDNNALREWIKGHQGAGLSPQRLRFWELILELPNRQVNMWLAEEGRRIWDQRRHV